MGAASAKVLLGESNQQRYREFSLNKDETLSLPCMSSVPWISVSKRQDVYKKEWSHPTDHHIKFITENNKAHAFLWQTNVQKLKQGVRWGIIKTHSITSKVISTLGRYRITAHERIMKGMMSNSQALKLKLLDVYQDRFTALQAIESLVNKENTHLEFASAFAQYIARLQVIEDNLASYFSSADGSEFNEQSIQQIRTDLLADKARAQAYLRSMDTETNLRPYNRSRGRHSVLEFVKQQMIHGLYEFQGINQDLSYSRKRSFALTRGELNDFIEDARKEIGDHEADARNAVTAKHHGNYAEDAELITYDFSGDELASPQEQQALLAISFIEQWDAVTYQNGKPFVSNNSASEPLDVYTATRWKTHRTFRAAMKSMVFFFINTVKSIFVPTRPWEEEAWANERFHLQAATLRMHVKPLEPMWKKPFSTLMQMGYALMDVFNGISDFGSELIIKMPDHILDDWEASKELPALDDVLHDVTEEIMVMHSQEQERLLNILNKCKKELLVPTSQPTTQLAKVEYELSGSDQNDLLNSMIKGLTNFSTVFTHNIYAKDPLAGLFFTATYCLGIGMIYMPTYSASFFGNTLVTTFNKASYAMASSPLGASIAGGSTLAEAAAVAWDGLLHGPSGIAVNALYQCGEDPITIGAYSLAAYGFGYVLANGIAGHQIPWLSHLLQEDLGTDPITGYPLIGAKFAIMLYEGVLSHPAHPYEPLNLLSPVTGLSEENQLKSQRFKLIRWLATHAKMLPKLDAHQRFAIMRHIETLFDKQESESLKKLLHLENNHSIAYQIFSIPLAYVPIILRLMISPFLSLVAWVKGHPYPIEPVRRAGDLLFNKVRGDLSRLISVVANVLYLVYSLVATIIKMVVNIGTLIIGRVAALFDAKPAHVLHGFFASAHNLMRQIGEVLYPARAMKSVAVAHPTHTMVKTEMSYSLLLQHLRQNDSEQAHAEEQSDSSAAPAEEILNELNEELLADNSVFTNLSAF
ncbi:MAG: hypothetical protein P4L65_00900 [Legionella sp.]|nr:hypothetical protein [Legionella sp.]